MPLLSLALLAPAAMRAQLAQRSNGFVIFTSSQKLELVTKIAAALDAAARSNREPGDELLAQLARQFAYLDNSTLDGVHF